MHVVDIVKKKSSLCMWLLCVSLNIDRVVVVAWLVLYRVFLAEIMVMY